MAEQSGSSTEQDSMEATLTPFPNITGSRARARHKQVDIEIIQTRGTPIHFRNVSTLFDTELMGMLQAAWAVILASYNAAYQQVVYDTAFTSASHSPLTDSERQDTCIARTCVDFETLGGWEQITFSEVLDYLSELKKSAVGEHISSGACKTSNVSSQGNGSLLAVYTQENSEQEALEKGLEWCRSRNISVCLTAWLDSAGLLHISASYDSRLLDHGSADIILEQLRVILGFIMAYPKKSIQSSLTGLQDPLLSISNHPPECTNSQTRKTFLHSQFEKFARDAPTRVALEFKNTVSCSSRENIVWTYRELNEKANMLARHLLRRFGDLSNDIVPVCMERCAYLYVAVLGILKSGGAWCPIDPTFPPRRQHELLIRTNSRLLIVADRVDSNSIGEFLGIPMVNVVTQNNSLPFYDIAPDVKMGNLAYLMWTSGSK